ncbi:MAG: hypothetical protein M3M96_06345, partial [Candidatus Eremiobacteraeota bacterium]|nr:hypothetical protein [Candidatus Eremiobacteraeota bacterium]
MNRLFYVALAALVVIGCSSHRSDDDFVSSVGAISPAVVLLTMQVPGETKQNNVDDAYATGIVVASGRWGSDILTVQHAIAGAWNLHVTIANSKRVPGR